MREGGGFQKIYFGYDKQTAALRHACICVCLPICAVYVCPCVRMCASVSVYVCMCVRVYIEGLQN